MLNFLANTCKPNYGDRKINIFLLKKSKIEYCVGFLLAEYPLPYDAHIQYGNTIILKIYNILYV